MSGRLFCFYFSIKCYLHFLCEKITLNPQLFLNYIVLIFYCLITHSLLNNRTFFFSDKISVTIQI